MITTSANLRKPDPGPRISKPNFNRKDTLMKPKESLQSQRELNLVKNAYHNKISSFNDSFDNSSNQRFRKTSERSNLQGRKIAFAATSHTSIPKSKNLGRQLAKRKQKGMQSSLQQDEHSIVNYADNNTPDIFHYSRTDMQNKKI